MLKLTELDIMPSSLGSKLWLVDVRPAVVYVNGQRTDTISGYRYTVALPEKGLDKIDIKIDGKQLMDAPNGFVEVRFDDLKVFLQWYNKDYRVAGSATGIHLVNPKS